MSEEARAFYCRLTCPSPLPPSLRSRCHLLCHSLPYFCKAEAQLVLDDGMGWGWSQLQLRMQKALEFSKKIFLRQ
jgi:hypothetical protein